MTVVMRDEASDDLDAAFTHYQQIRNQLAADLLTEFRRAIDKILTHPNAWQALDDIYRRCRLRRFPYGIVYRLDEVTGTVIVVAFMHLRQMPDSWRGRGR